MMESQAWFTFDPALKVFLDAAQRADPLVCSFNGRQSTKHLIESLGVPHTEVADVWANGSRVALSYLVQNEDVIRVVALTEDPIRESAEACFVLDSHLGSLAAYLRMLGLDAAYRNDYDDAELAQIAAESGRILLTRDRRLLMRSLVQRGYWVRSKNPRQQVRAVLDRYALYDFIQPFRRCLRCNGGLEVVEKAAVAAQLKPLTKRYYTEFRQCTQCGQVYWRGSHFERMQAFVAELLAVRAPAVDERSE